MCGIAGFSLNPDERPINARRLAQALLLGIEPRGRDATGAAWRTDAGRGVVIQKADATASEWVKALSLPRKAQAAILHTRAWTQGSPKDNNNNHPIVVGSIAGVHNGMVANDDELFADLGEYGIYRQGQVDSEAIFATLAHAPAILGDKFEHDIDLLERIQGSAAIAYMDATGPKEEIHLARIIQSPLVIAQTVAGSLVFASTVAAVEEAMDLLNLDIAYLDDKVKEGTYFRVRSGLIVEEARFNPDYTAWYNKYTTPKSTTAGLASATPIDGARSHSGGWRWCVEHEEYDWFCDCAVKKESEALTVYEPVDPQVSGWMAQGIVETANLFTVHDVAPMPDDKFFHYYNERVEDIESFTVTLEELPSATTQSVIKALDANHWQTRPGDWVRTTLAGVEQNAQVLEVPPRFPGGDYLLRILIPANGTTRAEYVMARRQGHEFRDLRTHDDRLKYTAPVALAAAEQPF